MLEESTQIQLDHIEAMLSGMLSAFPAMKEQIEELIEFKRNLERTFDEMKKNPMLSMMMG